MDKIEISLELASKLAGVTQDALKTELTSEGGEVKSDAAELFSTLVTNKFKEVERDRAENSYKRGIKEKAESIETALKPIFRKHGITAEKLEDAAAELADKLKKVDSGEPGKPGKPEELTTDQIKKLPAYQQLLDEELSKANAKAQEWEQKYQQYTAQVSRDKVITAARERAMSILDSKNAVWGPDKLRQLEYFFKAVGTDHLQLSEDGKIELMDKDGQPLRDDARNRIEFDNYVLNEWKSAGYTFHEAPAGSGTPAAGRGAQGGQGSTIKITSPEQYEQLLKEAGTDLKRKSEIHMAFSDFQRGQP